MSQSKQELAAERFKTVSLPAIINQFPEYNAAEIEKNATAFAETYFQFMTKKQKLSDSTNLTPKRTDIEDEEDDTIGFMLDILDQRDRKIEDELRPHIQETYLFLARYVKSTFANPQNPTLAITETAEKARAILALIIKLTIKTAEEFFTCETIFCNPLLQQLTDKDISR